MKWLALILLVWAFAPSALAQDGDGDALADAVDGCPTEAETYDGASDEDGCPEPGARLLVRVVAGEIELLEPPRFDLDSRELRPASFAVLASLAALLAAHPELGPIVIEGHMSAETEREAAYMARGLWHDRADTVMAFLVFRGVPQARLTAIALLTDRPRCDPSSVPRRRRRACWRQNDRIVIRLAR